MKKILDYISKNTYLVFILTADKAWQLIKPLFDKTLGNESLKYFYYNFDWFGFFVQILTVSILFFTLRAYFKVKDEINTNKIGIDSKLNILFEDYEALAVINQIRDREQFHKEHKSFASYSTDQGSNIDKLYNDHFKKEFLLVKDHYRNHKTTQSLDEILTVLYRYYSKDKVS